MLRIFAVPHFISSGQPTQFTLASGARMPEVGRSGKGWQHGMVGVPFAVDFARR
jgi:hypothetical protein